MLLMNKIALNYYNNLFMSTIINKASKFKYVLLILLLLLLAAAIFLGMNYAKKATPVAGTYQTYSQEKLTEKKDTDVVIFFHDKQDLSSRVIDANLVAAKTLRSNFTLLKADFGDEALRNKYDIKYPNTFIRLDKDGKEIRRNTALTTMEDIERLF
jgi:hypothetical protein